MRRSALLFPSPFSFPERNPAPQEPRLSRRDSAFPEERPRRVLVPAGDLRSSRGESPGNRTLCRERATTGRKGPLGSGSAQAIIVYFMCVFKPFSLISGACVFTGSGAGRRVQDSYISPCKMLSIAQGLMFCACDGSVLCLKLKSMTEWSSYGVSLRCTGGPFCWIHEEHPYPRSPLADFSRCPDPRGGRWRGPV